MKGYMVYSLFFIQKEKKRRNADVVFWRSRGDSNARPTA